MPKSAKLVRNQVRKTKNIPSPEPIRLPDLVARDFVAMANAVSPDLSFQLQRLKMGESADVADQAEYLAEIARLRAQAFKRLRSWGVRPEEIFRSPTDENGLDEVVIFLAFLRGAFELILEGYRGYLTSPLEPEPIELRDPEFARAVSRLHVEPGGRLRVERHEPLVVGSRAPSPRS